MSTTLIYSFNGNGNATYSIGSLVSWHPSALIADQIKVFLNGTELTNSSANGFTINEADRSITFRESSSDHAIGGSEIVKLQRVTPDTFFSTLETVGAASGAAALSNDRQLLNRIQETENSIVVAAANTSIKDNQDRLVSILNPGTNVGFSHDSTTNTLTISSSGGGGGGGSITLTFAENSNTVESGTSFTLSSANTGFASTSAVAAAYYTQTQVNSLLGAYVQTSGFNALFDSRFATQIASYNVKNLAAGSNITLTESPAGTFTIAATAAASVSSLNGETGALTLDMRTDAADDGPPNTIGLAGCDHTPSDSSKTVTTASQHTSVDGWSWIHDSTAGSFVTHKPLSGTRNSEITGGKTLTVSGTLAGDGTNNEIDLASTTKIVATAKPTKSTHIPNIAYDFRRSEGFKWVLNEFDAYTAVHANTTAQNRSLLLPISGQATDPLEDGGVNGVYRYPTRQCYDNTGYLAPGQKTPVSSGVAALYVPGVNFHPLEGTDGQAYSEASQYATTTGLGGYFEAMGVTEPLPSSGNINSDAPLRIFNPIGFTDPTSGTANKFGKRNIRAGDADVAVGQAYNGHINADRDYPYIIYVPASDNGGFVTVSAEFNASTNENNTGFEILMFTGMDEGNKSFGAAASIIPVAVYYAQSSFGQTNQTLSYVYLNNDSKPRYFGFTKRVSGDNSTSANKLTNVTVQRGSVNVPTFGSDFHSVMTGSGSIPNNRRAWDDKFVAAQVAANFVAQ